MKRASLLRKTHQCERYFTIEMVLKSRLRPIQQTPT